MKRLALFVVFLIASIGTNLAHANTQFWSSYADPIFCWAITKTNACSEALTWVNLPQAILVSHISVQATFSGPDYNGTDFAETDVWITYPFSWVVRVTVPMYLWASICAHSGWHTAEGLHAGTGRFLEPQMPPPNETYTSVYRSYCDCGSSVP
jgi:hypothetical protein